MVNLSIRLLLGGWGKMDKDMEQVKQILAKDRFAIDTVELNWWRWSRDGRLSG